MGRKSSTGLPFLIERPDTHKFSYHRTLPETLAPHVAGAVQLSWTLKTIELRGRASIKISLSTGDEATARTRWASIHHQIENHINVAHLKLRAGQVGSPATRTQGLTQTEIRHMAEQVRHDVLAEDDRLFTDPDFRSPLADVVLGLLSEDALVMAESAGYDPRWLAQDIQRKAFRRDLKRRDLNPQLAAIKEGEVGADVIAKLKTLRVGDKVHDVLSDEEFAAHNQKPVKPAVIPSRVDALLASNGIALPPDHQDKGALALAMLRAEMSAHRIIEARRSGDPTETPDRPALLKPAQEEEAGKTLSQMRTRWIELVKPKPKQVDDNELYVDYFVQTYGDIEVKTITKKMVRAFRDLLAKRARNLPDEVRKLTLQDQITWSEKHSDRKTLSRRTVNTKGVGSLSVVLQIAVDEDEIDSNPCTRQFFKLSKTDTLERLPYSLDDLNKIFSSPIYADDARWDGGGGEAAFWIPLIGLFAGARLEEIGQLLIADIMRDEGITFFDFTEIDEAAETAGLEGEDKDIKTEAGRRKVPVHPILVELGFLRYVAKMRTAKFKFLFPELRAYRSRRTQNWSKWWSRYTDEFVTKSPRKVFHSLRHLFLDRMRNIFGQDETARPLAGHAKHMYGQVISIKKRDEIIRSLNYPGLDLGIVRAAAARLWPEK